MRRFGRPKSVPADRRTSCAKGFLFVNERSFRRVHCGPNDARCIVKRSVRRTASPWIGDSVCRKTSQPTNLGTEEKRPKIKQKPSQNRAARAAGRRATPSAARDATRRDIRDKKGKHVENVNRMKTKNAICKMSFRFLIFHERGAAPRFRTVSPRTRRCCVLRTLGEPERIKAKDENRGRARPGAVPGQGAPPGADFRG